MRTPKTIIYLVGLYCIVSAILFIGLSGLAISAFACVFDFTGSPLTYVMYLMYFRRTSCHSQFNWEALEITNANTFDNPIVPQETAAVLRTFTFAIFYLVLNLCLIVAALRAMSGVGETSKNRHLLFWSYYSFIFIFFIAIIVLDFLCAAFYLVEFFLLFYNSDHFLTLLEISNKDEMEPLLSQLSTNTRSMPSMIFFLVSSKFILLLTLNIALIYSLFTAVWKVCRDNQKQVLKIHAISKKREPSPVMSIKSIESVHEVPPYETYTRSPKRAAPARPQSNPPEQPSHRAGSRDSQSETFSSTLDIALDDMRSLSSATTAEENDVPDIHLPRVPYEKSSFQYPSNDDYDQPQSFSNTKNRKTHF